MLFFRINMNWTLLVVVLAVMMSSVIMFIEATKVAELKEDAKRSGAAGAWMLAP
jgi:hypothetical protein